MIDTLLHVSRCVFFIFLIGSYVQSVWIVRVIWVVGSERVLSKFVCAFALFHSCSFFLLKMRPTKVNELFYCYFEFWNQLKRWLWTDQVCCSIVLFWPCLPKLSLIPKYDKFIQSRFVPKINDLAFKTHFIYFYQFENVAIETTFVILIGTESHPPMCALSVNPQLMNQRYDFHIGIALFLCAMKNGDKMRNKRNRSTVYLALG